MERISKVKKKYINLKFKYMKSGRKKAETLKESKAFYKFGNNNEWYPSKVPSNPELLSFHNNIIVAAHVYFCTHDLTFKMLNRAENTKNYQIYLGTIEVFDNVFIGANSTIMYNVKIGPNAIVAAGSVVTKDVPEGKVVAGNPAKVIGTLDDFKNKRLIYQERIDMSLEDSEIIEKLWS